MALYLLHTSFRFVWNEAIVPLYFMPELAFLFRRVSSQSKNFEDENFEDSKSSVKTDKITYLENLYIYGTIPYDTSPLLNSTA